MLKTPVRELFRKFTKVSKKHRKPWSKKRLLLTMKVAILMIFFLVWHKSKISQKDCFHSPDQYRSRHRRCSVKEMLLKLLQNSQGNTRVEVSFFMQLQT